MPACLCAGRRPSSDVPSRPGVGRQHRAGQSAFDRGLLARAAPPPERRRLNRRASRVPGTCRLEDERGPTWVVSGEADERRLVPGTTKVGTCHSRTSLEVAQSTYADSRRVDERPAVGRPRGGERAPDSPREPRPPNEDGDGSFAAGARRLDPEIRRTPSRMSPQARSRPSSMQATA